ncbi:MAG: hypothetical protein KBT03_00420, partial [Bacteroidales bacterium]|nr:hypothetical protein [Candidatus Scybalousia scybalohippi]
GMRFNSDMYSKLFPTQPVERVVETPVETFTPTKDKEEETRVESIEVEETVVDTVVETGERGEDGNSNDTD